MKFILLTAIFFCSKISFSAQIKISNADTSQPKQEFKLSRKEFLEKYGKDDSSRALINFYFKRRSTAKIGVFTAGVAAIFSGTVFGLISNSTEQGLGADLVKDVIGKAFLGVLIVGSIFFVLCGIIWITFSRRMLLKRSNDYFEGRSIPSDVARSHLFKKIMRKSRMK